MPQCHISTVPQYYTSTQCQSAKVPKCQSATATAHSTTHYSVVLVSYCHSATIPQCHSTTHYSVVSSELHSSGALSSLLVHCPLSFPCERVSSKIHWKSTAFHQTPFQTSASLLWCVWGVTNFPCQRKVIQAASLWNTACKCGNDADVWSTPPTTLPGTVTTKCNSVCVGKHDI